MVGLWLYLHKHNSLQKSIVSQDKMQSSAFTFLSHSAHFRTNTLTFVGTALVVFISASEVKFFTLKSPTLFVTTLPGWSSLKVFKQLSSQMYKVRCSVVEMYFALRGNKHWMQECRASSVHFVTTNESSPSTAVVVVVSAVCGSVSAGCVGGSSAEAASFSSCDITRSVSGMMQSSSSAPCSASSMSLESSSAVVSCVSAAIGSSWGWLFWKSSSSCAKINLYYKKID